MKADFIEDKFEGLWKAVVKSTRHTEKPNKRRKSSTTSSRQCSRAPSNVQSSDDEGYPENNHVDDNFADNSQFLVPSLLGNDVTFKKCLLFHFVILRSRVESF